jgi:hypothetical protein
MTANAELLSLAAVSLGLVAAGAWIVMRYRRNPDRRERERRLTVARRGRLGDGTIDDTSEDAIYYSYNLAGVEYIASQDIRNLRGLLPPDLARLIGPVTVKYASRNPANSIVLCEEWSGLRIAKEIPQDTEKELKYR